MKRYDVINSGQWTVSSVQYNTAGSVVKASDAAGHQTQVSYADAFSANGTTLDSGLPLTLAYPTTLTDPDNYTAKTRYNYHFGAPTWKQTPQPNTVENLPGPEQQVIYDSFGRLERVKNLVNNAYTRYLYGPNYVETFASVNTVADEAHSLQVFDGHGRVIGKASNHPGSVGGFSGQLIIYDHMGRVIKQSNPTETAVTISGTPIQPYGWTTAGDDAQAGWLYTQQSYDWKGRPLVTTNTDGTTKEASYGGCGCAGGEVVTLTDEANRRQKVYSDVLGRQWKMEVLNWDSTVYSTTTSTVNARDQVTLVRQFQGADNSGVFQETTMTYDGYGRLLSKHVPEQDAGTATIYTYNSDDTINSVTDARGATCTYGYNGRHLTTSESHTMAGAGTIDLGYGYDAVGNRTSMSDGAGSSSYNYDQLSRLTSETRYLSELAGTSTGGNYTMSYSYNLSGQVTSISDPSDPSRNATYVYDSTGRVTDINGAGYGGVYNFANLIQYRASGATRHVTYGNGLVADVQYNSRLQTSRFELKLNATGARIMGMEYRYTITPTATDNDGRLKFAHDLDDSKLDRTDAYNQAGRISNGSAGVPFPNQPSVTTGPYQEGFSYDVWGNLTGRSWRQYETQWTPGGTVRYPATHSYSETYVNNRSTSSGWQYDADGRLLSSTSLTATNYIQNYGYDAAGSMVTSTAPGKTITMAYDGSGQRIKFVENNDITYYVISTVLGQAVSELNQFGQEKRSYVYAGPQVVAKQENNQVLWDNRDASGRSTRMVSANATVTSRVELDPLSVAVDPTNVAEGNSPYSMSPVGFYGTPQNPNTGCSLGGVEMSCGYARHLVEVGGYDRRELFVGNPWSLQNMLGRIGDPLIAINGHTEYYVIQRDALGPDLIAAEAARRKSLALQNNNLARFGLFWVGDRKSGEGGVETGTFFGPQNSKPYWDFGSEERRIATQAVNDALDILNTNLECRGFLKTFLSGDNPEDVLRAIKNHGIGGTGGIVRGNPNASTTDVAQVFPAAGRKSRIFLFNNFFSDTVGGTTRVFPLSQGQARSLTILHELAHAVYRNFHTPFSMSSEELDRKIFEKCYNNGQTPLPQGIAE